MEVSALIAIVMSGISASIAGLATWAKTRRARDLDQINAEISQGNNQFEFVKEWSAQFEKRENEWKGELKQREELARQALADRERQWFSRFESQSKLIVEMKGELGVLTGRFMQASEQNAAKDIKIAALEAEVARLNAIIKANEATAVQLAAVERGPK